MSEYGKLEPIRPPESPNPTPDLPPIPEPEPKEIVVTRGVQIGSMLKLFAMIALLAVGLYAVFTNMSTVTALLSDVWSQLPMSDILSTFTTK